MVPLGFLKEVHLQYVAGLSVCGGEVKSCGLKVRERLIVGQQLGLSYSSNSKNAMLHCVFGPRYTRFQV